MIRKTALLVVLPLALSACGSDNDANDGPGSPETAQVRTPKPMVQELGDTKLVVDANGVGVKGKPVLRFGTARAEVEEALTQAFGAEPDRGENAECGAGPMQFSSYGPLQVAFQDGLLAGWFLRPGTEAATSDGVQPGTTSLAMLKEEREIRELDTTLSGEFEYTSADYGTIGGFTEDGRIVSLHAGMTCFFR